MRRFLRGGSRGAKSRLTTSLTPEHNFITTLLSCLRAVLRLSGAIYAAGPAGQETGSQVLQDGSLWMVMPPYANG